MPKHFPPCRRHLLGGLLLISPVLAQAQTPPDAGQLLERSLEPLTVQPLQAPRIETPAAAPATTAPVASFPVQRLRITGATVFSEEALHALIRSAEGRMLSFVELQALTARITHHYRDAGYLLARAYLPPQEISGGVVEIAVLEGRLEKVVAEDSAGLSRSLRRRLHRTLPVGQPLRRQALERSVLLHDALPGIAAAARLRAGDEAGGTVVVVDTRQEKTLAGEATVDNYGDRYTGELQGGVRLEWNNPSGRGDQLALRAQSAGEGRVYGRLGYDFSLYGPWRATVATSSTRYELGEEFKSLEADGWARTASLELRYPLVLAPALRLSVVMGADHMQLVDRIGITGTERDKDLTAGRLGLTLQASDRFRGQSALSVQATSGRVDIHDAAEQAFDAVSVGSEGGFSKFNVSGERLQSLPGGFQLRGTTSLQWALNNLSSSQKLPIGGPNGVRAYPAGEAQGDDGQLVSLELRRALPVAPRWQPTAVVFADYGHVDFNHDTWTGFAGETERELSGAGVGLEWNGPWGLGLTAYQAWPLKNEPVTAESDSNHLYWVSGRVSF
ncbi:MAG: Polypeptide-transport-associated domain protein ShlB-type [Moraxellaceae bacterium]|nr:Polypeptide-transport-associated domain protein ShlB-type [Moraxellaceae bacterium]